LHHGHQELLRTAVDAAAKSGESVEGWFEMSLTNVDKGALPLEEAHRRISQFSGYNLLVTDAPTFLAKARLFSNSIFVVGYDTAVRIIQPKYYNNSEESMLEALHELRTLGTHIFVAGRLVGTEYFEVDRFKPPEQASGLFGFLPGFRCDISSTLLREKAQAT